MKTEKEMPTLHAKIPVTKETLPSVKKDLVVGVITAGVLVDRFVVPKRDTRRQTGYQREPSAARVNRLANDLRRERVALPTAILLNLRTYAASKHLSNKDDHYVFTPQAEPLHVVDGQHRVLALARLVDEDQVRWGDYPIPFVCMLGASEREEMEQFYVVNSTAKSVRTDLALDLLKQRADTDGKVYVTLAERGESWKVDAQDLVVALCDTQVWKGRIRLPGDHRGDTTISSSGLAGSFKPLFATPYFEGITTVDRTRILDAFWKAIRDILPGPFQEPSRYALQKSVGVMVLHPLLVTLIEHVRSKGDSVLELDSYKKLLRKPLLQLEGDSASGEVVKGPDFWLAAPHGAAGAYSSNAGQRVLIQRLRSLLPRIAVE